MAKTIKEKTETPKIKLPRILSMADQKVDEATYQELMKESGLKSVSLEGWKMPKEDTKIPPLVDINRLPKDKQEELKQAMKEMAANGEETKDIKPADKEEPETNGRKKACKNCGHDPEEESITITEEDKASFLRSILGQKPWYKTYEFFGGKFKITFRTRSMLENDAIAEQCGYEISDGRIPTTGLGLAQQIYMIRLRRLQLTVSLARVEPTHPVELPPVCSDEGKELYPSVTKDGKPYLNSVGVAHDTLFSVWPETVFSMAFKYYATFEQTYLKLMENSVTPDFWKETVGQN